MDKESVKLYQRYSKELKDLEKMLKDMETKHKSYWEETKNGKREKYNKEKSNC